MKMTIGDKTLPQRGEIWLVNFSYKYDPSSSNSLEVESTLKKLRPCLIISNDEQNENSLDIIICPITSKDIDSEKSFEMLLKPNNLNNLSKDSKILLNLIFTMNREFRLKRFIGKLNDKEIKIVEKRLKLVLDFDS